MQFGDFLSVQDGVKETGVSIAYTVRQLDAGPVIACERVEIDDQVKVVMLLLCCSYFLKDINITYVHIFLNLEISY